MQARPFVKPLSLSALLLGMATFSSCLMGPDYEKPVMPLPEVFRGAPSTEQSIADLPWWDVIKDAKLKTLLKDTYANNRDLRVAMINVNTAAQYVDVTAAPLFPWLGYAASASRGQNQSGGSSIVQTGGAVSSPGAMGAAVSWELDLWGKTARAVESADADYMSSIYNVRYTQLSMLRQVSSGYLQLLMLDEKLRIAKEAVESYRKSLELFTHQFESGVSDMLQVESGRAALVAAEAQVPDLENQISAMENTLSALAGRMPGKISRQGSLKGYASASRVRAGVPASILAHRPDVLMAESKIRSSNAKIGVAIANYFPSISLTGSTGFASADLTSATANKFGWGMGASLTGPIFQAGRLTAEERIARDELESAIASYEQTVINAMAEVSTTLIARGKLKTIIERQEVAVEAYISSLDKSMTRYTQGLSSYYEVLTAQQNLFPAQMLLAAYRFQYAESIPTLYAQLGGGWQNSEQEVQAGAVVTPQNP